MRGVFRYKAGSLDRCEYYFIVAVGRERPLTDWGVVQIHRFAHPRVVREFAEAFPGEGTLLVHLGLKYLMSHLSRGRLVYEVAFED